MEVSDTCVRASWRLKISESFSFWFILVLFDSFCLFLTLIIPANFNHYHNYQAGGITLSIGQIV